MNRALRIPLYLLLATLLVLAARPAGSPSVSAARASSTLPTTLLVRMRDGLPRARAAGLLTAHGLRVQRRIPRIDVWVVHSGAASPSALLPDLLAEPDVLWAEPNGWVHAQGIVPDDTYYQAQQWNLRLVGLPEAWVFTTGDAHPIAVIDTGVDLDHPDLAAKIWTNPGEIPGNGQDDDANGYVDDVRGWDFVHGDAEPQDDHSHGSHVAGIAAAHSDNGTGIAGVAWQSPIMALKALNSQGDGAWADVAEAIVYAADNGARVVNLSLGAAESSQTIEDAVAYARSQDCLLAAVAGNSRYQYHPEPIMYPAALPGVLAVAATTDVDEVWTRSNAGPEMDVAAPGVDVFSANRSGGYYVSTGTSMAVPHVSGVAALVWALRPTWTALQVAELITSTARDVYTPGWDPRTGWGRIDAQAAVLQLVQPQVELAADRTSVPAGATAALTASVTTAQGQPVPDGLTVTFLANAGNVQPQSAVTHDGQATATFSSTQCGEATVVANAGLAFEDALTLTVTPGSDITVTPPALASWVESGGTTTATLIIGNVGAASLSWTLAETPAVDWLSAAPTGGSVAPPDHTDVTLSFDAASLEGGAYSATLQIASSDPDEPRVDVPVSLTVTQYRHFLPLIRR
jgi:subtilisin family serine protease